MCAACVTPAMAFPTGEDTTLIRRAGQLSGNGVLGPPAVLEFGERSWVRGGVMEQEQVKGRKMVFSRPEERDGAGR